MQRIGVLDHDRVKYFPTPNVNPPMGVDFENPEGGQ